MRERWKEPREGSEIEHETVSLQAVEERLNARLRACWRMSWRLVSCGKVKKRKYRSHSESEPDKGEVPGSNPGWPKKKNVFYKTERNFRKLKFWTYKSQANKSLRRIPWCSEAMKGVATDDTFRGTGSKFWSENTRIRKLQELPLEYIKRKERT